MMSGTYGIEGSVRRPVRATKFDGATQPGPSARAFMQCAYSAPISHQVYLNGYPAYTIYIAKGR